MRFKKGKPYFTNKDTWSLDIHLANVICEGVKKFKSVINEDGNCKGVPASISTYMEEIGQINYGENFHLSDEDFKKCEEYYQYVLDEVIYAFDESKEPKIKDYDFHYNITRIEPSREWTIPAKICSTNEEESERYSKDLEAYNKRCDKGRMLFAKHFNSLWW